MPLSRIDPLKTQLLLSDGSLSELGGVKLAGTIRQSRGIGRPRMRVLGSYALVYILRGGGEYGDANGRRQRVRQGDLIWVFPELAHFYGPTPGGRWDEIYFLFTGPFLELWREQRIISSENPIWHLEPIDFWAARLEEMTRPSITAATPGRRGHFHQMSRWQALVADMLLAAGDGEDERNPAWLMRACRELERDGAAPALDAVARRAGLSYETFRKKFTRKMGVAPAKYRQAHVIERACALLMQRDLSHAEIAGRLGFCDEFHFSKVFRQRMGFSPRAFRLKVLEF